MSNTSVTRPGRSRPGLIIFSLALAGLCASFMQTLLVPIQGQLPELLQAPVTITAWAMTFTQLVSAVWMPIAGRLSDMFGKKTMLIYMLALLILGSTLAAITTNVWVFLLARGIQGAGFGVIIIGMSIVRDEVPPKRVASTVGLISSTLGIGSALGIPLAAFMTQAFDWKIVFWLAAVFSACAMFLCVKYVPKSTIKTGGKIDWLGIFGLVTATTLLLLIISNGRTWQTEWLVPAGSILVIVIYVLWVIHETRTKDPLVDIKVNSNRSVLLTNVTGLALGFALFVPQLSFPQILTLPGEYGGVGLTLTQSSLVIMPLGLAMLAMAPVVAFLETRISAQSIVAVGALLMGVGYLTVLIGSASIITFILSGIIIGSGTGLSYSAIPAVIMQSVPMTKTGSANGVNSLVRSLGTAFAAAIVAGMLSTQVININGTEMAPAASYQTIFILGLISALVCSVLAKLIPKATVTP